MDKKLTITKLLVIACFLNACGSDESENDAYADQTDCTDAYGKTSESLDVLPYQVGDSFVVLQANCDIPSHTLDNKLRYSYDFTMTINTPVTAMRSGVVEATYQEHPDNTGVWGEENYVLIRHDDETLGRYFHFTQFGVVVEQGERVEQGDLIGYSGNSGGTSGFPHLHVDVKTNCGEQKCSSIPLVFKNASPNENVLTKGKSYRAADY